jgi:hypothetical protein
MVDSQNPLVLNGPALPLSDGRLFKYIFSQPVQPQDEENFVHPRKQSPVFAPAKASASAFVLK